VVAADRAYANGSRQKRCRALSKVSLDRVRLSVCDVPASPRAMPSDRRRTWRGRALWVLALGFGAFGVAYAVRPRYRLGLLAGGWTLIGIGGVGLAGLVLAGGAAAPVLYVGLVIELLGAALAFLIAARTAD
jgi:hypothetical protein